MRGRLPAWITTQRIGGLKVEIDDYALERHEHVTPEWTRVTTTIVMRGGGLEGRGEDVTYEVPEHDALAAADPVDLSGVETFDEASNALATFGNGYRRWGFESAVLDLALRQAGRRSAACSACRTGRCGSACRPAHDVRPWLEVDARPGVQARPGADVGRPVHRLAGRQRPRARARPEGALPGRRSSAWRPTSGSTSPCRDRFDDDTTIEDAWFADGWLDLFRGHEHRLAFDAIIHSVADIEALPILPRRMNIKPSRFGPVANLLATIEFCKAHRIALYGGGQTELGVGRDHIQALASLFYSSAAERRRAARVQRRRGAIGPAAEPAAGSGAGRRHRLTVQAGRARRRKASALPASSASAAASPERAATAARTSA